MSLNNELLGYNQLSMADVTRINTVKSEFQKIGKLIEELESSTDVSLDKDWVKVAKLHAQQSAMALVRAITKPTTFA